MLLIILSLGILVASGGLAVMLRRQFVLSSFIGAGGAVLGCVMGLIPSVLKLFDHPTQVLRVPWGIPFGSFHLQLDALSAWFLIPIFGISLLAAIYGTGYMAPWQGRKSVGTVWFFFNVLIASMSLVVLARDGILFLISWELMSVSSFFLVTFEHEKKIVRDAGWNYLVATHVGTACLLALFTIMASQSGSFDFDGWKIGGAMTATLVSGSFLLAVIGFGTKAGLVPLHIWLPEAHPAAPSHVSAVMSGVMIKTGLYGLIRFFSFFVDSPPSWWAWVLIGLGALSGVIGILTALLQRDLKRFLAYSSVENIGIITMGLGLGLLGLSHHSMPLIVLGFSGSLLHVLNHAFFKGLLFMGAGSVLHSTKTLDVELLGGLFKRMPWTGATFLVGAVAISGLPPLNGFVSEFLIYLAAVSGMMDLHITATAFPILVATALVMIGGLSAAAFTRIFGVAFLGEPRTAQASTPHESGWAMRFPMAILSAGCLLLGLAAPFFLSLILPVLKIIAPLPSNIMGDFMANTAAILNSVVVTVLVFIALASLIWIIRWRLLSGREVGETETWGCGFLEPSPRMQYTATSYAQPLASLFQLIMRTKKKFFSPSGFFPKNAALSTVTPDVFAEYFIRPFYHGMRSGFSKLKRFQHGQLQAYILYIGITLLILLIWNLR